MPCYTTRVIAVDLALADRTILLAAMRAAKFVRVEGHEDGTITAMAPNGYAVRIERGQLMVAAQETVVQDIASQIKRSYTQESLSTAARRFGYTFERDRADAYHVTLIRRSF